MAPEERVELAIYRTRDRLSKEVPHNLDILHLLDILVSELGVLKPQITDLP